MNTSAKLYFTQGCGRCPLGGTPECKVHAWADELQLLRSILLDCGLKEECKWGVPCYTFRGKNVLLLSAFKQYCSISFFKGSLLNDAKRLLVKPGPNSQAARIFKFENVGEIEPIESDIKAYVAEAIALEKAGVEVPFKQQPEPLPEELTDRFDADPVFKSAFEALTPGRQRGYILYFSQAKQPKTRVTRIEKCAPIIMAGIGLHDKYQSAKNK